MRLMMTVFQFICPSFRIDELGTEWMGFLEILY